MAGQGGLLSRTQVASKPRNRNGESCVGKKNRSVAFRATEGTPVHEQLQTRITVNTHRRATPDYHLLLFFCHSLRALVTSTYTVTHPGLAGHFLFVWVSSSAVGRKVGDWSSLWSA